MAHSLATSGGRLRVIPLDSPEDEDDDDDDRAPQQEVSPQGSKMRMRFNKVFTPFRALANPLKARRRREM